MKYLDEFSDPELAGNLIEQIKAATTRRWAIMEVCGGQTIRSSGTASTNCCPTPSR